MSYPYLQQWQYVEITTKNKETAASSTYYFSNRPIIDDTNVGRYIPILESVGSFGCRMGDYLPEPINSEFVLNNAPGSFGYERRFSDLLDRETVISQTVKLYVAQTELNDLNVTSDFSLA